MEYTTKEAFLKELSAMIDDCIENGGTYFDANIDADVSCFYCEDEDDDFLSDLANEAVIDEMCSSWIGQLLERLDKDSIEDLTIEDLRDEIEEMHGTIENESILIGVSGYAEENIEHFEAYIEYLEALIEEKEERI
jgi:hypothetical protein